NDGTIAVSTAWRRLPSELVAFGFTCNVMGWPLSVAASVAPRGTSPSLKTCPKVTATSCWPWVDRLNTESVTTVPATAWAAPSSSVPATHPYSAVRNFWRNPPLGTGAPKRSLMMPMQLPEMRVGFLASKSARPGAGRHTVPCNRRGARGRVNEQIAGLWTGAPRKLKTVNQWRIRRVPTSVRHRLTAHARGQPRTQCLVVCPLRRKPRDAARFDGGFDLLRNHCRNSHGLFWCRRRERAGT